MKKNKKRSKRYDPIKATRKVNEHILNGMAVLRLVYADDEQDSNRPVVLVNRQGKPLSMSKLRLDALTKYAYKWQIQIFFGQYDKKGNLDLKIHQWIPNGRVMHSQITDQLNDDHGDYLDDLNSKGVYPAFTGWTAQASGRIYDEDTLFDLLDGAGAWIKTIEMEDKK